MSSCMYVPVFSFPMMSQMSFSVLWPATSSNVYCLGAMMLRWGARAGVGDLWQDEKEVERGVRLEKDIEEEGSRSSCDGGGRKVGGKR